MKKLLLTPILFIFFFFTLHSQVLVNQVWATSSGEPDNPILPVSEWDDISWTSSILTVNKELIVAGNTKITTGNTDILITKYDHEGVVLWEQTYGGSAGSYDYGLAITEANNGDIIVAGVITNDSLTSDIIILKYNNNGSLIWSEVLESGNNKYDIPTAITSDSNGNVFVIGSTLNTPTDSEWKIFKLNTSGITQWSSSYDYSNLQEIPVSIILKANIVAVRGFSNSTSSNWDFAELEFSQQNGTLLDENRTLIPNISLSDNIAVDSDSQNNIYVGGSTTNSGNGNQDFQLVKINTTFDIEWTETIDSEGFDDKVKSLVIDNSDNIIIAGNSPKANGGSQITISKFDHNGNNIFNQVYLAPISSQVANVEKIKTTNDDDIIVVGSVDMDGNKDFVTLMYNTEGYLKTVKTYNGIDNYDDVAKNVEVANSGEILVVGKSTGVGSKYTTVKYETLKRSDEIIYENDRPSHKANEVIVKFSPQYVNSSFVDNLTRRYGNINDILTPLGQSLLNRNLNLTNYTYAKVYPRMTTSQTASLTRLGDTIPVPKFWSTFLVILPQGEDLNQIIGSFESTPEAVVYAEKNHVFQLTGTPNDIYFGLDNQQSLFASSSSLYPDANINMESAWDLETGQDYTKVGIYDSQIYHPHEDFGGDGAPFSTIDGTQVKGGYNYRNNSILGSPNGNSHGTAVAGIIGALRDNNLGIAGIAGGGLDAQGNNNPGVQLYSQVIADEITGFMDVVDISPAIKDGALDVISDDTTSYGSPGLGLHIMNHSWGGHFLDLDGSQSLIAAVRFTYQNDVLFVAAKGNNGLSLPFFPADYNDLWVLAIGASGTDGQYKLESNGDNFNNPCGNNWRSNYGGGIDIVAPGVTEIVSSLIIPGNPWELEPNSNCTYPAPLDMATPPESALYQGFNGTSAAAPHVAGVAALMHGLHNVEKGQYNNLAPEDYEFLLQRYATDVGAIEYDSLNGHGRINATAVIEKLEAPFWGVIHSSIPDEDNITIENMGTEVIQGVTITTYKVTHTYKNVFPPTAQIIDAWGRYNSPSFATFEFDIDNNIADVTATIIVKEKVYLSGQVLWEPTTLDNTKSLYSLHVYDANGIVNIKDPITKSNLKVIPNPNNGIFTLKHDFTNNSNLKVLNIFDATGKIVLNKNIQSYEQSSVQIDLSTFPNGIYFCQLQTEKEILSSKIIKQ